MTESEGYIPLRVYMETRFETLEALFGARLDASIQASRISMESSQIAISKAEESVNLRLAGMNEFRAALSDQSKRFITTEQHEALISSFNSRLDSQRLALDSEVKTLWKFVYGLATAIAVIEAIMRLTPVS